MTRTSKLNQLNQFLNETGGMASFAWRYFRERGKAGYEFKEFLRQCYFTGYTSFPLVGLTGFIVGMVLTMQLRPALVQYGVESQLPQMVGVAIIREIGPIITALIFAGKIASSMGAELGSMKETEQIDAMEVSGTSPFKYLVVTRVAAATLTLPILVILADAVALYGSFVGMNIRSNTSFTLFFRQVMGILRFGDVLPAFVKTFFFGFAVGLIGCYKGFNAAKGTEGVGKAANTAVVIASVSIFFIDLIAVQITDLLGLN
jgi:phospholipid/cholesterol/gamma-HCH transport system permease protein